MIQPSNIYLYCLKGEHSSEYSWKNTFLSICPNFNPPMTERVFEDDRIIDCIEGISTVDIVVIHNIINITRCYIKSYTKGR